MKLGTYVVLIVTMIAFLEMIGVPTGASNILSSFGIDINPTTSALNSADIESSTFFYWLFGTGAGVLVIAGGIGAVIVGLFAKSYDPSLIALPLIVSLGSLLASTIWTIIKYAQSIAPSWATNIVGLIMIGIGIGFVMSCVDYFVGR